MKYVVAEYGEMPDGARRIVTIGSRSIGVFRVGDRFFAVRNRCPHQSGPLCRGAVHPWVESDVPGDYRVDASRSLIACPWHGWEYDLETGQSWFDPKRSRVRAYPVSVESGSDLRCATVELVETDGGRIQGPYTAETFEVTVEGDYVVVDIPGVGAAAS